MKSLPLMVVLGALLAIPAHGDELTSFARAANKQNKAKGIPFRWETTNLPADTVMVLRMLPLPVGPSKADATLTSDTLASMSEKEQVENRGIAELEEVRLMQDGGEVWILKSNDGGIAYVVHFENSPQGGVDIRLSGPYKYVK
jgi:hypothetical protein